MALNPIISQNSDLSGELKSLELAPQPTGGYTITKYPFDLGTSEDNLHYVVFYINVPLTSKYESKGGKTLDPLTASHQNFDVMQAGGGRSSKPVTLTQGAGAAAVSVIQGFLSGGASDAITSAAGAAASAAATDKLISLKPKLKRITECVAIYMPEGISTNYSHNYSKDTSVTAAMGKMGDNAALAAGAVQGAKYLATGGELSATGAEAAAAGVNRMGQVGPGYQELALKSAGVAKNPQHELIFQGTNFREFSFKFRFQPRSRSEADSIQKIIKTFKRFAAPEMLSDTQNGRYFIPPGQFDIKFYYKNEENRDMMKLSTCVLENVSVDYTSLPGGFVSFDDGMPAQITMDLKFTEADVIYRELIESTGY
jgi:hypothetical protein